MAAVKEKDDPEGHGGEDNQHCYLSSVEVEVGEGLVVGEREISE